MSDDLRYLIIMTEGIHDLMTIGRFLRLMGFEETKTKGEVPQAIEKLVPDKYPFNDNELSWVVPCPSFYHKDNVYVIMKQGGGSSMISTFSQMLDALPIHALKKICSIAFIADADNVEPADKKKALSHGLGKALEPMCEDITLQADHQLKLYNHEVPCQYFIMPDNKRNGTVENMLLQGAEVVYPELLKAASGYLDAIPNEYKLRWKPFDHLKVTVGVIANALKPGKANQVSIHDNKWICSSTIEKSEGMQKLKAFLEDVVCAVSATVA